MSKFGWFVIGYLVGGVIGYLVGGVIGIFAFNYCISDKPAAMDVYQEKTILQYTVVDGEVVDSCVIWKN